MFEGVSTDIRYRYPYGATAWRMREQLDTAHGALQAIAAQVHTDDMHGDPVSRAVQQIIGLVHRAQRGLDALGNEGPLAWANEALNIALYNVFAYEIEKRNNR